MKYFAFLLLLTLNICWCEPSIEGIQDTSSENIIASFESSGVTYMLEARAGEHDGGIFILKKTGDTVTTIGGDSVPFPLSKYGVPENVAKELANQYVDREIKIIGLDNVKAQIADREKLPHDLKEAYSRYMDVNVRSVYAVQNPAQVHMMDALERVERSNNVDQVNNAVNEYLRPVIDSMIQKLAYEPNSELGVALLKAVNRYPGQEQLQLAASIYAGRQPKHFLDSLSKCEDNCRGVAYALRSGITANLIGYKLKPNVNLVLESLDSQ